MSLIGLYDNDSIRMEEVDIEELFAGVAQLEKYQLEEKGMRLETRAAGQKRMLDRDLFESFLINLIDNAVKAGKEGDSILLEATEGNQRHRSWERYPGRRNFPCHRSLLHGG
ncbi:MAG: sensor histidine kinase [Eisenbergiella sp.]